MRSKKDDQETEAISPAITPAIIDRARELRRKQTPAEKEMWGHLRNRQLFGFRFRRQHPIGSFIVDFYCAACRLVVEIDGDSHAEQVEYDSERTAWLSEQGYRVIRFTNRDVIHRLEGVLEVILSECERLSYSPSPQPSPQRGEGASPFSSAGRGNGSEGDILSELTLSTQQVLNLHHHNRSRFLNFLLRWEHIDALHACLDVLIPQNPTLVSLRDLQVKAFLAQGRPADGLPVVEERLQKRESFPARALLARVRLALGDTNAARRIVLAMTDEREDSALAWSLLGEIELAGGDEHAALDAYRRLHELYPHSRAYLLGMAELYRVRGDLVTASGYAVQLLRQADVDNPLSIYNLRQLRDYFQFSGETTRVAELEVELARRYADELDDLREHLSPDYAPAPEPTAPVEPQRGEPVEPLPSFDAVPVSAAERRTITDAVQRFFGFDSLLPGQVQTMAAVLRGEDVLTVLPTGGGKSLCYQLPAMLADEGTTLVISPLIALMKDQVDSLPQNVRQRATTINSTLDGDELRRRIERVADGVYRLVYAAPERLRQPPFLHALRRAGVERLVIDEAHCVSVWGHDFRPDYLIIGRVRDALGNPPLLAMTATAPLRVRKDILRRLGDQRDAASGPRVVAGDVTRSNLQLEVFRAADLDEKLRRLLAFCKAEPVARQGGPPGSGIVYADTRARCEELAALLRQHGISAAHYHAGIEDRSRVQDDFMAGRVRVVVATVAFGMGIDKPDIRFIVHFFPPSSLESYYQEAGRAGRDGLPARCLLMHSSYDKGLLTRRVRRDVLAVEFLREVYAAVRGRLGGKRAGRVAAADLERDLRVDNTRVRVALSLLEEAGLLWRGPDLPRAAMVRLSAICRDDALPDELSAFRVAARLRSQQWLTLDLGEVARGAGIPPEEIEQRLLGWEDEGWLMYRPSGRDFLLKLLPPPDDSAERVEALLERYETVQIQRVDEITAYAETPRCRHGHLNAYLGGRVIERCEACDNCVKVSPPPDPGLPDERAQLLTVLQCVDNAPWGWGRNTIARILRGDFAGKGPRYHAKPLHRRAYEQAEFGALAFRSKGAVKRLIERLEYASFLKPRELEHGGAVLELTSKGKRALRKPAVLDGLIAPQRKAQEPRETSAGEGTEQSVDEELFELLRKWRREQAREQGVASFVILHNRHLRAIAAKCPTTREALSDVKGIGPKRMERYGAALLDLVRGHLEG